MDGHRYDLFNTDTAHVHARKGAYSIILKHEFRVSRVTHETSIIYLFLPASHLIKHVITYQMGNKKTPKSNMTRNHSMMLPDSTSLLVEEERVITSYKKGTNFLFNSYIS